MNPQSSAIIWPFRGSAKTKKLRQEMRQHLRLISQEILDDQSGISLSQNLPINSALIVFPRMRLKRKAFQRWFILHNVLSDFSLACQSCRRCGVGAVRGI